MTLCSYLLFDALREYNNKYKSRNELLPQSQQIPINIQDGINVTDPFESSREHTTTASRFTKFTDF